MYFTSVVEGKNDGQIGKILHYLQLTKNGISKRKRNTTTYTFRSDKLLNFNFYDKKRTASRLSLKLEVTKTSASSAFW